MHCLQGPGPSPHGASRKSQGALPARALMACGDCPIPQHHHTDPPPHNFEPSNRAACCMGPALWVSRDAASGADTAGPPSTHNTFSRPRVSRCGGRGLACDTVPHFSQAGCWVPYSWVPYSVSVPYLPCPVGAPGSASYQVQAAALGTAHPYTAQLRRLTLRKKKQPPTPSSPRDAPHRRRHRRHLA